MPEFFLWDEFEKMRKDNGKKWTCQIKKRPRFTPDRLVLIRLEKKYPGKFLSIRSVWNDFLRQQVDWCLEDIKQKHGLKNKIEAMALILKCIGYPVKDPRCRPTFHRSESHVTEDWEEVFK